VSSNIFSNDPSGPEFVDDPVHFGPEVAVVVESLATAGCAVRLAGIASDHNISCSNVISFQFPNIIELLLVRPVLAQNTTAPRIDFAERDGRHAGRFQAKREAAYS